MWASRHKSRMLRVGVDLPKGDPKGEERASRLAHPQAVLRRLWVRWPGTWCLEVEEVQSQVNCVEILKCRRGWRLRLRMIECQLS
jgi:hypothetical protein